MIQTKNVIPTIYGYLLSFAAENGAKKKKKDFTLINLLRGDIKTFCINYQHLLSSIFTYPVFIIFYLFHFLHPFLPHHFHVIHHSRKEVFHKFAFQRAHARLGKVKVKTFFLAFLFF